MGNNLSKKHFLSINLNNNNEFNSKYFEYYNNIKIKSGAMQGEFGEKKFIKPWRTGTKSQQQIPPRGQRKGFRGKTLSIK